MHQVERVYDKCPTHLTVIETYHRLGFLTEDILEVRASSFDNFWLCSAWAGGGSEDDGESK
jgi:hypothetical protein